jgi:MoaA/NifB/PqqE/SkfB family radical SAM enzyme
MNHLYGHLAARFIKTRLLPGRDKLLPMKLTVASTFLCNHQCTICGIWAIYRDAPGKLKEELTLEDYGRVFGELKESLLFLDWGGGEPFMRNDMGAILRRAVQTCTRLSSVVITTNGLLTARILETVGCLAEDFPHIRWAIGISLDGDEPTHDAVRGKPGAYQAAVATIQGLRELATRRNNIEVKISYTLCSANAGRFETFHHEVLKPLGLAAGDVGFNLEHTGNLFQTDTASAKTVGHVSEDQFRAAVKRDVDTILQQNRLEKLGMSQRLKSFYREFFLRRIPGYLAAPKKMVIPCQASRNSLYLDPYGNLYPCITWGRQLGNIRDGVKTVLASAETEKTRKLIDGEKCPICWNACEVIPTLLTSWRMPGCALWSLLHR